MSKHNYQKAPNYAVRPKHRTEQLIQSDIDNSTGIDKTVSHKVNLNPLNYRGREVDHSAPPNN